MRKTEGIWRARHLFRDRKWQIGDPARLGPPYIPGPFATPIHFRVLLLKLKGQDLAPLWPEDTPRPRRLALRGYLSSLVCLSPKKATSCFSSKSRKNWNLRITTPD